MFHFGGGFFALLQVILIDITLAGDNAIVIGMAASRVPRPERRKVIFWGLVTAVVMRVALASVAMSLFNVIGFMLAGGILLLWVSWRLYRDLRDHPEHGLGGGAAHSVSADGATQGTHKIPPLSDVDTRARVRRAVVQIAVADASMSLDNVLAVAGAALNHFGILVVGLLLSIGLVGVAASMVAKLLHRHPWISYAGLFIIVYVAVKMIAQGTVVVVHAM